MCLIDSSVIVFHSTCFSCLETFSQYTQWQVTASSSQSLHRGNEVMTCFGVPMAACFLFHCAIVGNIDSVILSGYFLAGLCKYSLKNHLG